MSVLPRGLAFALLASLAANLFLAGVLLGDWLRPLPKLQTAAPPPASTAQSTPALTPPAVEQAIRGVVQRMLASVPAELRPEVERKLAGHRAEIQRANQELRAARQRVRGLVTAPVADRSAIANAYAELRERNAQAQKSIHEAVIDAFADLPAEVRVNVVNALMPGGRP